MPDCRRPARLASQPKGSTAPLRMGIQHVKSQMGIDAYEPSFREFHGGSMKSRPRTYKKAHPRDRGPPTRVDPEACRLRVLLLTRWDTYRYLLVESGLAAGPDVTSLGSSGPIYRITRLTSAGHDFADSCRNPYVWDEVMEDIGQKGFTSVAIDVVKKSPTRDAKKRLQTSSDEDLFRPGISEPTSRIPQRGLHGVTEGFAGSGLVSGLQWFLRSQSDSEFSLSPKPGPWPSRS